MPNPIIIAKNMQKQHKKIRNKRKSQDGIGKLNTGNNEHGRLPEFKERRRGEFQIDERVVLQSLERIVRFHLDWM